MSHASTLIVGPGYLGRRVGRLLHQRGARVWGTTRSPDRVAELARWGIEGIIADVTDPASLASLPAADRVLFSVGFDRSAGMPVQAVYVDGLRNTLEALRGRVGSLVYASSTGVYGGDGGEWLDETSPVDPRTESARACLEAEGVVREFERTESIPATILRYAGLYGPGRIMRREALLRGEPVSGDPDKWLNLVHIDDAAAAAVAALDRTESGLFIVADDRPAPRSEFYRLAAEALGAPEPRFVVPESGSAEGKRDQSNKRVRNARMRAGLLADLIYPDIRDGVPASLNSF